jgi:uncharacterized RDD family membrane protein YckC
MSAPTQVAGFDPIFDGQFGPIGDIGAEAMSATAPVAASPPKAGFWIRFVAYLIDVVIVGIPLLILGAILGAFSGFSTSNQASAGLAIWYLIAAVGSIGYFIYFWSAGGGQTPGMRVFKLRVIKTDGSPVSTGSAFLRYIGMIINSIIFGLPIGFIWAAFDPNKQGWHDKIASTYVIRVTA